MLILVISSLQTPLPVSAASLSAPSNLKVASASFDSISISWSGVSGASGYSLYRSTSKNGTYKLLKTTTEKSFKNTGLTTGTIYYYKIRAYKTSGSSKVYGSYSTIKSAKAIPAVPASITASSSSYNSIAISWEAVKGASGYRIYLSSSVDGIYELLKTTCENHYESTGLVTGSVYYYKVRAYRTVNGTKIFGGYTEVTSAKPALDKPGSLIGVASPDGMAALSWSGSEGASGYRIYRAAADGSYARLSDIPTAPSADASTVSYNDIGLTSGETYSYKVRAYISVGSSNVYSSYTSIVTVTIPIINVTSVSLDQWETTLILGNSGQLAATIYPENAANKDVVWSSSDDSIVTVDESGSLVSQNSGTAVITVLTVDGQFAASCAVTVVKAQISGIDVSKWQGTIDWTKVKNTGIEFAMLRASYGSSSTDPMFEINYSAAKENGIALGAYHYSYATTIEKAQEEVQFLLGLLAGKQFEYPICVDVEDSSMSSLDQQILTDIVLVYLTELSDAGYYPMIYSSKTWFTARLDEARLTHYDHWLAQWSTSMTYTNSVTLWQYSSTGKVDGISANVDLDISYIDYASRIKQLGLNGF
jgi:GH25 family lysozyme M1 (1,4-beta-N-acetylmuramidase)/fibronectin type 3 domain-containing protein